MLQHKKFVKKTKKGGIINVRAAYSVPSHPLWDAACSTIYYR